MKARDPVSDATNRLHAAIARVCAPDSFYWFSRGAEGLDLRDDYEVEVRLDVDPENASRFVAPSGWQLAHTKPQDGMVFLRRSQPLTDDALKAMFAEVLTIAVQRNGRFHSWMHAPGLANW